VKAGMPKPSRDQSAHQTDGDALIADQIAYYRARASEYDDTMRQLGRYISKGGSVAGRTDDEDGKEVTILLEALDGMRPFGTVLELACGTGWWTQWLAQHARHVTAVDAAEEMLALNRERVKAANVRHILADVFSWKPGRQFDLVFFAFWMSHVPRDRFAAFWQLVGDSLAEKGRVFFIDELDTGRAGDAETRVDGDAVLRVLEDGRQFRAVKVFYQPSALEAKLRGLGWNVEVRSSGRRFYWGRSAS
jgi:demethylmenaquinone methyltransferase/2-methoxy-6-polyprenyl-1,4-benzoquinol methylase